MSYQAAIVFRDGVTRFINVKENELLLDASFRQGISLPTDCRQGVCSTCRGLCESGEAEVEYADEDALSQDELNQGYILACQTRLKADSSFYFDVDSHVCSIKKQVYQATVKGVCPISKTAAILEVALNPDQGMLQYLPGQYARIQVPNTEEYRAYSYANAVSQTGLLRFLIRLLPTGVMSDYLRDRSQVGDKINIEGPLGAFYLRQIERPLLLVAGGTGLSAFLSMLDTLAQQKTETPVIRLCYGVTEEHDLSELERLNNYTQELPNFSYQVVVMKPSESWQGARGVVTDIFDQNYLSEPFDAYLCGPPPMIEATQAWLKNHPVAHHRLYFEKFISS